MKLLIFQANPSSLDTASELYNLQLINESSILHILRNRCFSSLPFTLSTHESLIYLTRNPQRDTENYKLLRKVSQPFILSKLYPNLYSLVRRSYRALITTRKNQSIVIHGQGDVHNKREILRETLNTFCGKEFSRSLELGPTKSAITNNPLGTFQERLTAILHLVEFFCSSDKIVHQKETALYNLEFDVGGRLVGVNAQVLDPHSIDFHSLTFIYLLLQIFCLDTERLYESPFVEVLQCLHDLAQCPIDVLGPFPHLKGLRKDLLLEELESKSAAQASLNFFCGEIFKSSTSTMNLQKIGIIADSFLVLGQGDTFVKSIWSIFGALYHFGK